MKRTIERERIGLGEIDQSAIGAGASQATMGVILTLAVLIGTWGLACLVSGMSRMGGIVELARAWFTAVTGV